MSDEASAPRSLGDTAARQLANATKTVPQFGIITPRWLIRCLQWVPVEAGVFRLNRVKDASSVTVDVGRYEHDLLEYATRLLRDIPGLRLIGTAREKAGVISFVLDGVETTTVGRELNEEGVAVRAGHHCAQPTLRRFGVETSVRPSLALYNTFGEIDTLAATVRRIQAKHAPYR